MQLRARFADALPEDRDSLSLTTSRALGSGHQSAAQCTLVEPLPILCAKAVRSEPASHDILLADIRNECSTILFRSVVVSKKRTSIGRRETRP